MMMKIAGKSFKDTRIGTGPGCTPYAQIGPLSANLGRVPICTTEAGEIGQAGAINYYVATQCGLMGGNAFEAAQILGFVEHIKELNSSWRSVMPWGKEPTPEGLVKFFDTNEAQV